MKVIENFSNYGVTPDGKVFSFRSQRFLLQSDNGEGYLRVSIQNDSGEYKTKLIHRLVAESYLPNPEGKATVNHKDCNKTNNSVSNLEWNTYLENDQHARRNSLRDNVKARSLTEEQAFRLFRMVMDGCRVVDICSCFGINKHQYRWYVYGDTYKHIRDEFEWDKRPNKSKSISVSKVIKICEMLQDNRPVSYISEMVNVSKKKILNIRRRETYRIISDSFTF